jgi:hypothetical protein
VVAAVVGAGVKRLRLDTDAVALVVPENAAGVLAAGLRHLGVTLLAGTAAVHDVLAGRAGLLDATREGLARVTSEAERAGVPLAVSARVPVCRHNVRDLPSAVLAAVQAGCGHVVLEIDDGGLDLAGALPWITAACDSGTVNSVWVEVSGLPLCLAGGHVLHAVPVLRPAYEGARPAACVDCRLDALCEGAPPGVAPDVAAAIAPPEQSERLEAAIRRAYLDPGPGEVE